VGFARMFPRTLTGLQQRDAQRLRDYLNPTGGPISGVFTGAAAPMAITTAFPPGFTSPRLSIFQLFVNQTLPDGSIWPPVIRCSESL
jgi:hypothetical protein